MRPEDQLNFLAAASMDWSLGQSVMPPSTVAKDASSGGQYGVVDAKAGRGGDTTTNTAQPPPGLTPSVSNAQTAAQLLGTMGMPYGLPAAFMPTALPQYPLLMQQASGAAGASSGAQYGKNMYPQQHLYQTSYEDQLADYGKAAAAAGFGLTGGQNKPGGLGGMGISAGDASKTYGATNKFSQQATATPPPYGTMGFPAFQSAGGGATFGYTNPGGAAAAYMPTPAAMLSPLAMPHSALTGDGMGGNAGGQRGGGAQLGKSGALQGSKGSAGYQTYPGGWGN